MIYLKNTCCNYLNTVSCNTLYDAEMYAIGQIVMGLATTPLQLIIHELAHATAARFLYKNANPKITLANYGYAGKGKCIYSNGCLSKAGEWLGESNVRATIHAVGPLVEIVTSIALLRLFPGNGYSFITLIRNAVYAVSASSEKAFYTNDTSDFKNGHDFVAVKINKGMAIAQTLRITSMVLGIVGSYSLISQALAQDIKLV